jgi:hypothetical protein
VAAAAGFIGPLLGAMLDALIGVVAGALALGVMSLVARLRSARSAA